MLLAFWAKDTVKKCPVQDPDRNGCITIAGPRSADATAAAFSFMELLEDDLTCPVCCCLFEDPRVLPCSHSFCRRCLEGALDGGGGNSNSGHRRRQRSPFRCPTCRKETPRDDVPSLPVNYALRGVVEKYGEIRALHGMMTTSAPVVPVVPTAPSCPVAPSCRAHSEQPLNIFCATDRRLICGFCATSREHRGHRLCALEEAHELERAALDDELLRGAELRLPAEEAALLARLDALETARRRALQAVSRDAARAAAYLERAARALEQRRAEVAADFEALRLAVAQRCDPEVGRARAALDERRRAAREAEAARALTEPLAFLARAQELREALRAISEDGFGAGLAPLPADWDPDALVPAFDVAQWDHVRLGDLDALRGPHELSVTLFSSSTSSSITSSSASSRWKLTLLPLLVLMLLLLLFCACAPSLRLLPEDCPLYDVRACGELRRWAVAAAERGATLMSELLDTAADFITQ